MLEIPNYTLIEKIYEGSKTLVYRAQSKRDSKTVILKLLKSEYPDPKQVAQLHHEFEIARHLNLINVIKTYSLEKYENRYFLVSEDIQGQSLQQLLLDTHPLDLTTVLRIALQIAEGLGELHARNIIHKDIKPANIIINLPANLVKITDFSISSQGFTLLNQVINNPHLLEGTLIYMSPEQTGRMNRTLDYRTDFYSLGIIIYEMLLGHPPFQAVEAMELVHNHLAKQPPTPQSLNPNIPEPLSNTVMKLLEKNAEMRYQSIYGLKTDLKHCLQQLETHGQIQPFICGQSDFSQQFHIPQKLYGRETEIDILLQSFATVSQGTPQFILVSGYSGIGKTALIQEIYKPITQKRGYFISGKFDQYQRNVPYSAIVKALTQLIQQLLTESETSLQHWRHQLLTALGDNGQIIIQVIPELHHIIGAQPAVPELNPTETQNRFNQVFQNFIRVFCQAQHPLVIFLDDLQWVDSATLKLIELIITDPKTGHLMLLGAYRDNEVSPTHPLIRTLQKLQTLNISLQQITLVPLNDPQVQQLLSDTLQASTEEIKPLAQLLMHKTQGNPFFLTQFLKTLYNEGLIRDQPLRTPHHSPWDWDLAQIQHMNITDNVVELMIDKLRKLPAATQQIIQIAACLGNRFDLQTLALIYEKTPTETYQELLPAIQQDLLIQPTSEPTPSSSAQHISFVVNDYRFLHDRVQQAAYTLINEQDRQPLHLKIARRRLANDPNAQTDSIFDYIDHYNKAQTLITDIPEIIQLAQLNLEAARKAKEATAYAAASQYLHNALDLYEQYQLWETVWEHHYQHASELHTQGASIEYLNGQFSQAQQIIHNAVKHLKTPLEKAEALHILIIQHTLSAQYQQAIEIGRQALQLFEIQIPEHHFEEFRDQEVQKVKALLGTTPVADLAKLPAMTDPIQKMIVKLLITMGPPCYRSHQRLWAVIVPKVVSLTLQYGNVPQIGYSHTAFGGLLGYGWQEYQLGNEFGKVATHIMTEQFTAPSDQSVFYLMIGSSLRHWSSHLKYATQDYHEAYNTGVQSGNLQYAAYAFGHNTYCRFYQGVNLNELWKEVEDYLAFSRVRKNQWAIDLMEGMQMILLSLLENRAKFYKEELTEVDYLKRCEANKNIQIVCLYYILKTEALYLQNRLSEALLSLQEAEHRLIAVATQGLLPSAEFRFLESLIYLALYPTVPVATQTEYWQKLEANQKLAKIWADHCPQNFLHWYELIAAEMAGLQGEILTAMTLYDQAITNAKEHNFTQQVALANQLAAHFWLSQNKPKFAQFYLKEAHYHYLLWGAKTKVIALEAQYPTLLDSPQLTHKMGTLGTTLHESLTATTMVTTASGKTNFLDISTIMKTAHVISGEIVLEQLFPKLMQIVIENVGAELGFLILVKQEQLWIEAKIQVTQQEDNCQIPADLHNLLPEAIPLQTLNPVTGQSWVPITLINYVVRTGNEVVLGRATEQGLFTFDPYVIQVQPKSIFCMPMHYQNRLVGVLYLENNLAFEAFTEDRLTVLKLLSTQIAIALQNALLYAQNEQARQMAESANRAKSTFLANMSHELRTPLNAISGFAQLFKLEHNLSKEQQERVDFIQRSGQHLLTLLNDILDLSKLEADSIGLHLSQVYLKEFLTSIVEAFQIRALHQKISFIYRPSANLPISVRIDEKRLRQILINLLGNAIKFTKQGGVTFEVTALPSAEQSSHQRICFKVIDTGIGIAQEEFDKLFVAFQQAGDPNYRPEGTGLGLVITQRLVNMMGGQLQVQSTLGKGSCFWAELDFQVDHSVRDLPAPQLQVVGYQNQADIIYPHRILIVEDEANQRALLGNLLTSLGFAIVEAEHGSSALEQVQLKLPDCVLIDLIMPVLDGFETIRCLQKQFPKLPIIALSESDLKQSVWPAPVNYQELIVKPVQLDDLLGSLQKCLGLTWVYESVSSQPKTGLTDPTLGEEIVLGPSVEEALLLRELAVMGDITSILERTEKLKGLDQELIPFAERVESLANDFEMEEIRILMEKFIR